MAQTCSIEGCDKPTKARGWCNAHYQLWRVHGVPVTVRSETYGKGRSVMSNGYVRVWKPAHVLAARDGYVLEHRLVWYDAHGPIPEGYDVHHLNEDRADNRLENLELKGHAEHWRDHLNERGTVTNQYGTWPPRANRISNGGTNLQPWAL